MAKRRAQPQVVFDPSKRPHRPSGPVHLDIAEAIARRRAQTASAGRTRPAPTADPSTTPKPSKTEGLKRPGELERVIGQITEGFRQADLTHRAAIDQQVMECFRVANFLKHNWRSGERLLGGEWLKFWGKHGRNGDAAIRFVFKKVHADAKKASFYYRATRKLFEEGVSIADVPARITAAGGYQELADKNVESPRGNAPTPPAADDDGARDRLDADLDRTKTRRVKGQDQQTPAAKGTSADSQREDDAGGQARLITVTASNGIAFFALPLPCSASLDVELSQNANGEWLMQVVGLKQIE